MLVCLVAYLTNRQSMNLDVQSQPNKNINPDNFVQFRPGKDVWAFGVEPHPHNLHSVLEKTVDDLGFAQHCVIDQRCKQFAIEIDPLGFAGSVEILLENALTHGATKIELEIFQETPLTLAIKDNGRGISSANVEQIFEPFFTTTRNQGGSGLGLSIAQALLKQNHCTLALQSASSPTTFTLTFEHHA